MNRKAGLERIEGSAYPSPALPCRSPEASGEPGHRGLCEQTINNMRGSFSASTGQIGRGCRDVHRSADTGIFPVDRGTLLESGDSRVDEIPCIRLFERRGLSG